MLVFRGLVELCSMIRAPEGLQASRGFLIGSLVGGALGFVSFYYCCSQLDHFPGSRDRRPKKASTTTASPEQGLHSAFDDEILSEQFTRNVQFFGSQGQQQVHDAFVVVVGLGVSTYLPTTPINTRKCSYMK